MTLIIERRLTSEPLTCLTCGSADPIVATDPPGRIEPTRNHQRPLVTFVGYDRRRCGQELPVFTECVWMKLDNEKATALSGAAQAQRMAHSQAEFDAARQASRTLFSLVWVNSSARWRD
ncbi:MAG: hypothetical protein AAF813_09045 [Pseudomonadota bacterium]